ncbi:hypothetical protein [Kribbella koreensis]
MSTRRAELGEFLKARRAKVTPQASACLRADDAVLRAFGARSSPSSPGSV